MLGILLRSARLKAMALSAVVLACGATAATAQCYPTNFAAFGGRLDEDMTEAQVVQITGYQPNTVSLDTCGQQSAHGPWGCKVETWGSTCHGELIVYFYKSSAGAWLVNSWHATAPMGF